MSGDRERPQGGVTYGYAFNEESETWYGGDFLTREAARDEARASCDQPGQTVYTCEAKHLTAADVAAELDAQDLLERLEERLADTEFGFHDDAFITASGSAVDALEDALREALAAWLARGAHLAPVWQAHAIEAHPPEACVVASHEGSA